MWIQPPIGKGTLTAIATNILNVIRKSNLRPYTELQVYYAQAQHDPVKALEQVAKILTDLRITTIH